MWGAWWGAWWGDWWRGSVPAASVGAIVLASWSSSMTASASWSSSINTNGTWSE